GVAAELFERAAQPGAVAEALGRHAGRQLKRGDLRTLRGVVLQPERVVECAERAAALADDRLAPLVQPAADNHVRRQLALEAAGAGDDRADRRPRRAGLRLTVEADRAAGAAGQPDRTRDAVVVGGGVQRAEDAELVGKLGDLREQL